MKAHRSLQQRHVLRHGSSKIAMMVASEFWRASTSGEYSSDVRSCYDRARELMGILETIPLRNDVAVQLQPLYRECMERNLLREDRLTPNHVRAFGIRLAESFEIASAMLAEGLPHA